MRMNVVHDEAEDSAALAAGSENAHAGELSETIDGVAG